MGKNSSRMQRLLDNKLIVRDAFLMIVFPKRPRNNESYATTLVFMPQLDDKALLLKNVHEWLQDIDDSGPDLKKASSLLDDFHNVQ